MRHWPVTVAALALLLVPAVGNAYEAQLDSAPTEDSLLCFAFDADSRQATTHAVGPGESIQDAIDAAEDGDVVSVAAGIYREDINFNGKAVRVIGSGPTTVIRGTGTGPVVTFANGESFGSVLDSVTVREGRAPAGGGIYINGSSPIIIRSVITENRAGSSGSGIFVGGGSQARIYNNLITYNRTYAGDPHSIQIVSSTPLVVNNTIARGDSNGILISGAVAPVIMNNVIAFNGSFNEFARGRGICDFSGNRALITFNNFYRNRIAALLRGSDWRYIEALQRAQPSPEVADNVDGKPGTRWVASRSAAHNSIGTFQLNGPRGSAIRTGNPDPACNNLDGTRNDMGFTGGPFAAGSTQLPGAGACGM